MSQARPPLPPFTEETAKQKVQLAEDAWNSRDPDRCAASYTEDTEWRNRAEFVKGRPAVREFLKRKWARELDYKLRKYLWTYQGNRIAVCFEYEYRDAEGQWYRAYGNENWEYNDEGLMRKRIACINEAPIGAEERRIAVDNPTPNTWLTEQGLAEGTLNAPFPLANGNLPAYPSL